MPLALAIAGVCFSQIDLYLFYVFTAVQKDRILSCPDGFGDTTCSLQQVCVYIADKRTACKSKSGL